MFMFLIIASVIYFISRGWNLLSLPVFIDEAIYLRWAQDIIHHGLIWVSFSDGKEPLFIWVLALFSKFIADPLLAGRLVNVVSGWGLMMGVYLLAKRLLNQKAAILAVILYLTSPFILFYNRIALLDNFLVFLGCFYLLFLVKKKHFLAGVFLGLALITKTNAFIFLIALPFFWPAPSFFLGLGLVYLPVFFAPGYHNVFSKDQSVFLAFSPGLFWPNFKMSLRDWWLIYFGAIPLLAALLGSVQSVFLAALLFGPWLVEAAVGKIFFPRYLLFMAIPVFLLAANFLQRLPRKLLIVFFLIAVAQPLVLSSWILKDVASAPIPVVERWQYLEGWPAGYGSDQLVSFLQIKAKQKSIIVVTEEFGLNEILKLKFYDDKNVTVKTFSGLNDPIAGDYLALTYYSQPSPIWPVREIGSVCKVQCKNTIRLYEITR